MSRHKKTNIPGGRNMRLADQIQKDLAVMIQQELDIARAGLITLTSVELTADYAHAKVYFTVMGATPEAAEAALRDKAGWLHSLLFKRLHIHTVPTLHFSHDLRMSQGMALSELIAHANTPGVLADDVPAELPDNDPGRTSDPEAGGRG
jgi:ribosome-binding factor A